MWKIKENHNISELAQKLYDEKMGQVNITEPVMFEFYIQ